MVSRGVHKNDEFFFVCRNIKYFFMELTKIGNDEKKI